MAKIGALPSKDIVDGFRGVLDYYCRLGTFVVRKWPRSPGRNRNPAVVAAQKPFIYINKLASTLPAEVIEPYQQLALGSGLSWKDYLTRFYINGSIRSTIIPHGEDYKTTSEKIMRVHLLDPESLILDIDFENASHPWTNLDLSGLVPTAATHAIIRAKLQWNAAAAPGALDLCLREKGTTLFIPCCGHWCNRTGGIQRNNDVLVGLDDQKIIQYKLDISAGLNDVWVDLWLLGYWYEV